MSDTTAIAVADAAPSSGIIKTPLAKLNELGEFMAGSGPMVSPSMQGRPDRCRAVAYLADRWNFDPFFVASETYFFTDRDGKERMAFGAKIILALINAWAPITGPLKYEFRGQGAQLQCIVTGYLKGASEPSVYVSPLLGQIQPRRSPLWTTDSQQQIAYYSGRAWSRRYCPQTIGGVYDKEEVTHLSVASIDGEAVRTDPYADDAVEAAVEEAHEGPAPSWPDVEDIMDWLAGFRGEIAATTTTQALYRLHDAAKAHGLLGRLKKASSTDHADLIAALNDRNEELKKEEG